ncbi:glycosyl hydrolase 115 family protein [Actinoplanes sp. NPDC051494]|uniref:glycosyl hydrolase 115 family protein n=1 Tax=Actinoplanes sp. NPDC051494 TaxID=3363907 RepID=UPI0037945537
MSGPLAMLMVVALAVVPPAASPSPVAAAPPPGSGGYVAFEPGPGRFPLAGAPVVVSTDDHAGVIRVADDLRDDLHEVTGAVERAGQAPIIIGTLGKSPLVDRIVARGKLDVRGVRGAWETTVEQVVTDPLPGVRKAFVIAGSDQRGTIYGAYDLSKRIGISPWAFWDDVPAQHHAAVYVTPGRHTQGTPAVKYRGLFINDENPATGTWAPRYFGPGKAPGYPGGLNAAYYGQVFETLLRLKGNYLWPAVWGRAFAEDDPLNHATATLYGVVMGTSHEAPMMRGIEEWNRHPAGTGQWSFVKNPDAIKAYWRDGAQRMADQDIEGVITLGMRGNGDTSLPDGDGIDLMRSIIDGQREILRDTGLVDRPQVQTLYKEVQRYWEQGYRPPDDVTVVFCDDNWGNMRKLPDPSMPARSGGYGMYYHFDYVGVGRNYKWADTANLTNTWEQLNRAYISGVDRLWVANVGDLKNEELPAQFFLDYAWDPSIGPDAWLRGYAAQNFGPALAPGIAALLDEYGRLQSRRKPELLNRRITLDPATNAVVYDDEENPFSLTAYREMDRVVADWERLARRSDRMRRAVPAAARDAYYQLVHYAIKDTAVVYALRRAQFTNIMYAEQGRAATNKLADRAEQFFAEDQDMSRYYNTVLAGGKWNGWQTQPKIGYGDVERYGPNAPWQQPELNNVALPDAVYPHLKRIEVPPAAALGVALDGGDPVTLPEFSPWQAQPAQYLEVYNKGTAPFGYRITAGRPWVHVTPATGRVTDQIRATVTVDWRRAPAGTTTVPITVTGAGSTITIQAPIRNVREPGAGFLEANGYVAMEADHYTSRSGDWRLLSGIGRTGNGLTSPTAGTLGYTMTLTAAGPVTVAAYLSPRNRTGAPLRYEVSLDGAPPQVVDIIAATGSDDGTMNTAWARNTSDNINVTTTRHTVRRPGVHTLTFRPLDPTIVVQRLVVRTTPLPYSYLGPPESRRATHGGH